MVSFIKTKLALIAGILLLLFVSIPSSQVAYAACTGSGTERTKCEACEGAGGTWVPSPPDSDCADGSGTTATVKVSGLLDTVINIFSLVVGITSVIMIIIGGFKYIISQGDSANISSAKNTILYAIIGLVVVVMAQVIVRFVLAKV